MLWLLGFGLLFLGVVDLILALFFSPTDEFLVLRVSLTILGIGFYRMRRRSKKNKRGKPE